MARRPSLPSVLKPALETVTAIAAGRACRLRPVNRNGLYAARICVQECAGLLLQVTHGFLHVLDQPGDPARAVGDVVEGGVHRRERLADGVGAGWRRLPCSARSRWPPCCWPSMVPATSSAAAPIWWIDLLIALDHLDDLLGRCAHLFDARSQWPWLPSASARRATSPRPRRRQSLCPPRQRGPPRSWH